MVKTEKRIAHLKELGVRFVNKMPDGWIKLQHATAAPNGYAWIRNGKNPFDSEYEHALLRVAH